MARFADDAMMSFSGRAVGPFAGREVVLAAHHAAPPDDMLTALGKISDGVTDHVRFRWSRGGTGKMTLRWRDDLVESFDVEFDS